MALNNRSMTTGKFLFTIDGTPAGYVQSFEGGNMVAELYAHKAGGANFQKKHVTTRKWTPVKVRTGIGMSKGLYEWMQAAFDMGVLYKNGAVTVCDFNYKAQRRMDALNMLMTKVTFPTLDGSSSQGGYFDIEMQPEQCRWIKEGGQTIVGELGEKQKAWHTANWRLDMAGLPCARVAKIEGLSWECKTKPGEIGDAIEYTNHPVATTVSDFSLEISLADLEPWAAKAKAWFVDGQCLEGDEMTATVTLLAPDRSTSLGTLELLNVGFKEFEANPKIEAESDKIARFKVKLYAERCKFTPTYVNA